MDTPYRRLLKSPRMWWPAVSAFIQIKLGSTHPRVKSGPLKIMAGAGAGQGLFCAISGLDYEPELRWLIDFLQEGDTFIDIGGNIGVYSLYAAWKVGPRGKVICVEPGPDAFRVLSENRRGNGFEERIELHHAAASSQTGHLYLTGDPQRWHSLRLSDTPPGEQIEVVTIDQLAEKSQKITAIKIDAEGAEWAILQGAQKTIRTHRPTIIFEELPGSDGSAREFLQESGYNISSIGDSGQLIPYEAGLQINIIATPGPRLSTAVPPRS